MKRLTCAFLALLMLLSTLTACGGNKMPKFDEDNLTTAQLYVQAVMKDFEIRRGNDFKTARVLFAEDMNAFLKEHIALDKWDASEIAAWVVVFYGTAQTDTKDDKKDETEYNSFNPDPGWSKLVYALDAEKKTVLKFEIDNTVDIAAGGETDRTKELPTEIAQAELNAENFAAKNANILGDFAATIDSRLKEDPDYFYSYTLWEDCGADSYKMQYAAYRKIVADKRAELAYYQTTGKGEYYWKQDQTLRDQKHSLQKSLYTVKTNQTKLQTQQADAVNEFLTRTEDLRKNADYLFNKDYVTIVLSNDTYNTYDTYVRQAYIYETSIKAVDDALATDDASARKYITNRSTNITDGYSAQTNAFKTYIQCVINQDAFHFNNEAQINEYNAASEAAKKNAGADYENDVDYLKVQLTYKTLIQQMNAHTSAVTNSKAAFDKLVTDTKAAVDKLDTAEEERLLGVAIANEKRAARDYMLTPTEYMDEYKAEDKQWGEVHPDYAAYQNEHLNYYTPNSGGNGFGCVFIYDDGHVCRRPVVKGKIYCSTHL